jgi:hypothetical protein
MIFERRMSDEDTHDEDSLPPTGSGRRGLASWESLALVREHPYSGEYRARGWPSANVNIGQSC